ncbi:lipoprotein [Secundilactobacillus odoratitofui DSM 19909 = JCM 15043]|uniref:Lipoprotein n=2 Tax=Secundilactobacillus odoratitofui TaxID=480930 RepID=A0A0R1LNG7_9LACO|nr:hypothetical protein [Secundilactobacillus odoratitofui]KRK97436.1 lipoprotein [Secundilactobacillus odoratitofui DSM 19909 = JCM 15043]
MHKKISLIVSATLLSLVLVGCGKASLTVAHKTYSPSGMTAIVKGHSNQKKVTYQVNGAKAKTQTVNGGGYAITLPAKPYQQRVKISAGSQHVTTVVKKSPAIKSYTDFKTAYNQVLMVTALSKKNQTAVTQLQAQAAKLKQQQAQITTAMKSAEAKLKAGDTSATATITAETQKATQLKASAAKLQQAQAKLAPALKKAKAQVADQTITATGKTGIYNLKKTSTATVRGNIDHGNVIGLTLMVPTSALKSTKAAKSFMTELAVLTNSVGANTKTVLNGFKNKANKKNSNQTTTSTIRSNHIDFDLGYSTSTLYIYITHH